MSTRATEVLRKENEGLKLQCKRMEEQLAKLSVRIDEKFDSRSSEFRVEPKDIQFLSNEYDELQTFRKQTKDELNEIKKNLS